jgi:murein DD-endopeptidase MepM/ murein hydrolase activator NlpD
MVLRVFLALVVVAIGVLPQSAVAGSADETRAPRRESVEGPATAPPLSGALPRIRARPESTGVWPLLPRPSVTETFDPPERPWDVGHRGVDLAGAPGQLVRTALSGRVSFTGWIAGRPVVVIDHGNTRTTYEPVVASVRVGRPVRAGDPMGKLSLGGSHCWPTACLHWGWRRGAAYLDPLRLVGDGPVRLLPLWTSRLTRGRFDPSITLAGVPARRRGEADRW